MQESDEQLISRYLEGEDIALSVLLDRYLSDVCSFAYSLTQDRQSAKDVAQEAFIKAWKHARRFVPGNSFRAWLFQIARNTAIDMLRKKKEVAISAFDTEEGDNIVLDTLADIESLPDELLARAEDKQYLETLLEQLNPAYREVLILRHTSNMTFEEIGKIVERPLHTVKSQYRRALTALQRVAEPRPI